jgi:DNA invertase Pin-like site-specific DNA recombinase
MLLDMPAAVARKEYDDRRRRQAQGQAKAKAEGRYKGARKMQSAMKGSAV